MLVNIQPHLLYIGCVSMTGLLSTTSRGSIRSLRVNDLVRHLTTMDEGRLASLSIDCDFAHFLNSQGEHGPTHPR